MKAAYLLDLEFGDFLGAGPDNGPAAGMRLVRQKECLLLVETEGLLQDFDHELEGMVVIVLEDHVMRRELASSRLLFFFLLCRDDGFHARNLPGRGTSMLPLNHGCRPM